MIWRNEKIWVILVLINAALTWFNPILTNLWAKAIPPIFFSVLVTFMAWAGWIFYLLYEWKIKELFDIKYYKYYFLISIFIIIIPSILFYTGTSMTSWLNTSFIPLTELIFTLIFTSFLWEKLSKEKFFGSMMILIGSFIIVYKWTLSFNYWDLLLVLSTVFYPIWNYYQKKIVNLVSPATILTTRCLIWFVFLLIISLIFERNVDYVSVISNNFWLIIAVWFLVNWFGKIIWFEWFKRMEISKSVALVMTYPFFSLIALIVFFNLTPTLPQLFGSVIIFWWIYTLMQVKSINPNLTKYWKLE